MEDLTILVGYLLIWIAISIGRKEESKLQLFSLEWVLQIILVVVGVKLASG